MTDTVISGSGNSRSIKTVPNALTLYPTHEAMIAAMVDGSFPIDLGPLNASGLTTRGTDLNKATLLTDALCTALGLATTATPTEAMEKLRQLITTAQNTADSANTSASGRAMFSSGSYFGTGSNKTIYTNFTPKLIVIGEMNSYYKFGKILLCVSSSPYGVYVDGNGSQTSFNVTWDSSSATVNGQAVAVNSTFYYTVFG